MKGAGSALRSLAITGGDVIDGTGRPRFSADVIVRQGLVSEVVAPGTGSADETLDAHGMVVCPGFIDAHSHDDLLVLNSVTPHPKLAQGVCTVVTGNCGISLAPLVTADPPSPLDTLGRNAVRFRSFEDYLAGLDDARPCVNVVPLIGHTSLRLKHVADLGRTADAAESRAMREEAAAALQAGAFGISTGVYYPPAAAASTHELVEVCAALKGRRRVLAMHIRDEGDNIDAALREALHVGQISQADLVLSHHKVVGPQNHGRTRQTLRTIEQAALRQPVCFDCYPYEASSTMLCVERAAQAKEVLITWSQAHPEHRGKTLESVARLWGVGADEAIRRLTPAGAIYFSLAAEDVERVLTHPLAMIGSDGLPHDQHPHPRLWGTFPRVLGHYSRDKGLMPLETAVHKMTGLPARRFGLRHRGTIAAGNAADLVVIDPLRIRDNATYEHPHAPPAGVHAVLVNGHVAVWQGSYLHVHAGRRLTPALQTDR